MAKIWLTQGQFATFSEADAGLLLQYKWFAVFLGGKYYAATKISGRRVLMHRMLMGLQNGDKTIVDHINGSGLDNQRDNIRLADATINQRNRVKNSNNTTGKTGIYFRPSHGSYGAWSASGMVAGRLVSKTFGCKSRGYEEAKRMAEAWRNQHEANNEITVREGVAA